MEDRTLPRIPLVLSDPQPVGVKVTPTCMVCGTVVPDLTDPKHHVCVPDDAGAVQLADGSRWTKTTRDVGEQNQRAVQAAADAAAKAKIVP